VFQVNILNSIFDKQEIIETKRWYLMFRLHTIDL